MKKSIFFRDYFAISAIEFVSIFISFVLAIAFFLCDVLIAKIISFVIIAINICFIPYLVAYIIGVKFEISEDFITYYNFSKRKTILKKDVMLVADILLNREYNFVVISKELSIEELNKILSPYVGGFERQRFFGRDKRAIVIIKSKKIEKILKEYGYDITQIKTADDP